MSSARMHFSGKMNISFIDRVFSISSIFLSSGSVFVFRKIFGSSSSDSDYLHFFHLCLFRSIHGFDVNNISFRWQKCILRMLQRMRATCICFILFVQYFWFNNWPSPPYSCRVFLRMCILCIWWNTGGGRLWMLARAFSQDFDPFVVEWQLNWVIFRRWLQDSRSVF